MYGVVVVLRGVLAVHVEFVAGLLNLLHGLLHAEPRAKPREAHDAGPGGQLRGGVFAALRLREAVEVGRRLGRLLLLFIKGAGGKKEKKQTCRQRS